MGGGGDMDCRCTSSLSERSLSGWDVQLPGPKIAVEQQASFLSSPFLSSPLLSSRDRMEPVWVIGLFCVALQNESLICSHPFCWVLGTAVCICMYVYKSVCSHAACVLFWGQACCWDSPCVSLLCQWDSRGVSRLVDHLPEISCRIVTQTHTPSGLSHSVRGFSSLQMQSASKQISSY